MFHTKTYSCLFFLAFFAWMASCKKQETAIPPAVAEFVGPATASYFITNSANSVYKIPVGVTTVSNVARTINFTVSSPTGAAKGTQYNLASTSVTIQAGKAVDSISVNGLFSGFAGSRRDTLVFTLASGDVPPASFGTTFKLVLQKYCDVNLATFTGVYAIQDYKENGTPDGGPYTVSVTPGTTTGTKGFVSIRGLWGDPTLLRVDMDWTSAANFTTNIADQNWFVDATYGQAKIKAAGIGSFSSCDNTITIRYEATVAAGSFGRYYSILKK